MRNNIHVAFLMISLMLSNGLVAGVCGHAFSNSKEFALIERLNCNGFTSPVKMELAPINKTSTDSDTFLMPGCDNRAVYFNLKQGSTILYFSDTVSSALANIVSVSSACDGKKMFEIDRHPTDYTLPNGKLVKTSLRVFAANENATLIAYSLLNDDSANNLVLRDVNQKIIATAGKSLKNPTKTGESCLGIWTVNNDSGQEQIATIISYLLTLKDNAAFSCVPPATTTPAPGSAMSAGAVILGVAIGAVLVVAGGVGVACYCAKTRPQYAKLKLIN